MKANPNRFKRARKYVGRAVVLISCIIQGAVLSLASAQTFLGEQTFWCDDYEIVIWGEDGDLKLFRNEGERHLRIVRSAPVVWFCGRQRKEFHCQRSEAADRINARWDRSGTVVFQCLGG